MSLNSPSGQIPGTNAGLTMDVRSLEDDLGGSVRHIAMGKVRHTVMRQVHCGKVWS